MQSLSEYLISRARELDAQEGKLREQKKAIDAERDQLWRAAKAAGDDVAKSFKSDRDSVELDQLVDDLIGVPPPPSRAEKRASEATIKDAVLSILSEAGRGLTALEILPRVNEKLGIDYPRTSLSPQLSRLKSEGKLDRGDGNVWNIVIKPGYDIDLSEPAGQPKPDSTDGWHKAFSFEHQSETNKGSDAETSEPSDLPVPQSTKDTSVFD